jgi:hypothetical protein
MSALHGTFETSVASAEATKIGTTASTEVTHQTSIDAKLSVIGYNNVSGNNANLVTAVVNANVAKLEALANAEKQKQRAVADAREALRADTVGDAVKF